MTNTCATPGPGFAVEGSTVSEQFVVTGVGQRHDVVLRGHGRRAERQRECAESPGSTDTPNAGAGPFAVSMAPQATHRSAQSEVLQRAVVKRR